MTVMTYEQWIDKFKPIQNHITPDSSFGGEMFETYGDDLEYVLQVARKTNGLLVWTYIDGDGGTYIVEGYRLVNRIGYFVTQVPYDDSDAYEIQVSEDEDSDETASEVVVR